MKITKIALCGFRGFAGPEGYTFDLPQGQNLLLYGENGSGKSSLYEAIKGIFNHRAPIRFSDQLANVFFRIDDGYVNVDISTANPDSYRWDQGDVPSGSSSEVQYLDIARRAVFLDYRDLLKTHFLHRDAKGINLFDMLVNTLLPDVDYGDGSPLSDRWAALQDMQKDIDNGSYDEDDPFDPFGSIRMAGASFRDHLNALLHTPTEHQPCLVELANTFLQTLSPGLRIDLVVGDKLSPSKAKYP